MYNNTQRPWGDVCLAEIAEPTTSFVPFRQGSLDSLCGIYAATNALGRLLNIRSRASGERLFQQLLTCAMQYQSLDSLVLEGIDDRIMVRLLREIAVTKYDLVMTRPFYHRRQPLPTLWATMREHTDAGGVAIIRDARHWTVTHRITTSRLILSDSMPPGLGVRYRHLHSAERWGFAARHVYFLAPNRGGKRHE